MASSASTPAVTAGADRRFAVFLNRLTDWLARHWLLVFGGLFGLYVGLPWLTPLLMELGMERAAGAIYLFYATQCHQLPQRSFFLFGAQPMYSLEVIQSAWQNTNDPVLLRQFIGNPEMGWKVAWSDRMVYMYAAILLAAAVFWALGRRLKAINWWQLGLFLLPMALDGLTHMISDVTGGLGGGLRETNGWLAALTGNALAPTFYAGDAFGSFNAWMRLLSGIFFGLGIVWFIYPRMAGAFSETAEAIADKFERRSQA